jgi:hypothetical protein
MPSLAPQDSARTMSPQLPGEISLFSSPDTREQTPGVRSFRRVRERAPRRAARALLISFPR